MSISFKSRVLGAIWGNCVADALGGPVSFTEPGTFEPITDLRYVTPMRQPAGSYSDGGAMTLALAQSIIDTDKVYDQTLVIQYFLEWLNFGRFSTTNEAWDVGISTRLALNLWNQHGVMNLDATQAIITRQLSDERRSGNGSLMRIGPVGIMLHFQPEIALQVAKEHSDITHPSPACGEACQAYTELICAAMRGESKEQLCARINNFSFTHPALFARFAPYNSMADWRSKTHSDIKSSGWVVDTLESALWGFFNYARWADGALAVVNLGGDADTAGAIYGALAGVFYGYESIPERWIFGMVNSDQIRDSAENFAQRVISEHSY
ncbi:hypothetical protein N7478_008016 [Penicillium angulare]|uniref:uncharacterized protein n=1 Tax=Penicillium angulare TaxID=116970 RepID=UPI002540D5BC|nr:uncharacterized protein N7478_008016 [Penicillium angulare]KAJ5272891.1 hypothetical protein N7478_008016 [Penicillium angulare]